MFNGEPYEEAIEAAGKVHSTETGQGRNTDDDTHDDRI